MECIHQESFRIHTYDSDSFGRATLPSILRFMQESATIHAHSFKAGISDLKEEGLFWVISHIKIDFNNFPSLGEVINVNTWGKRLQRIFCLRDFDAYDKLGNLIMNATSSWLVLDINRHRVQNPDSIFRRFLCDNNKSALEMDLGKLNVIDKPDYQESLNVKYCDLDMNGHANNTRYVEWMINSHEYDFWKNKTIKEFTINFSGEARLGDTVIVSRKEIKENKWLYNLHCPESDKELCRAEIIFLNSNNQ